MLEYPLACDVIHAWPYLTKGLTDFLSTVNFVFDLEVGNSTLDGAEQLVGGEADRGHIVRPRFLNEQ